MYSLANQKKKKTLKKKKKLTDREEILEAMIKCCISLLSQSLKQTDH